MSQKTSLIQKIVHFFTDDLWEIPVDSLKFFHRTFIRMVRVLSITISEFISDRCSVRASALTYYTLLAIIPILAIGFGIAQTLGFEAYLSKVIHDTLIGQEQLSQQLIAMSESVFSKTKGSWVAWFGLTFLLWTIINMLIQIELAFNDIWEVRKGRKLWIRIVSYALVVILAPVLVSMISASTLLGHEYFSLWFPESLINEVLLMFFKILPYFLVWTLLILIYLVIPNCRVRLKAACVSGFFAGIALQVLQYYYFNIQIGLSSYNIIYGSFAAIPLCMIWLRMSWSIVLWGAELAFSIDEERRLLLSEDEA